MIHILVYNVRALCEIIASNIVIFNLPRQVRQILFFLVVLKAEIYSLYH
jgi:hypothetical protein